MQIRRIPAKHLHSNHVDKNRRYFFHWESYIFFFVFCLFIKKQRKNKKRKKKEVFFLLQPITKPQGDIKQHVVIFKYLSMLSRQDIGEESFSFFFFCVHIKFSLENQYTFSQYLLRWFKKKMKKKNLNTYVNWNLKNLSRTFDILLIIDS